MTLLLPVLSVGILLLGVLFCVSLIGGLPWSHTKEFEPETVAGRRMAIPQISVGASYIVLGAINLAFALYILVDYASAQPRFNLIGIEVLLPFVSGMALLIAGSAVLFRRRKWRVKYLTCLALTLISYAVIMYLPVIRGPVDAQLFYTWVGIAFCAVGGLAAVEYFWGRLVQRDHDFPTFHRRKN